MPPPNPLAMPPGVRQPIVIEAKTGAADANGERTWVQVLQTVGVIATQSSREFYLASQYTAQMTMLVTIAFPLGFAIVPGMRVQFNCSYFRIQTVENVQQRNRILKLTCMDTDAGEATAQ